MRPAKRLHSTAPVYPSWDGNYGPGVLHFVRAHEGQARVGDTSCSVPHGTGPTRVGPGNARPRPRTYLQKGGVTAGSVGPRAPRDAGGRRRFGETDPGTRPGRRSGEALHPAGRGSDAALGERPKGQERSHLLPHHVTVQVSHALLAVSARADSMGLEFPLPPCIRCKLQLKHCSCAPPCCVCCSLLL